MTEQRYQRPWMVEGLWIAPKADHLGHRQVFGNTGEPIDGRLIAEYADNVHQIVEVIASAPVRLGSITADRPWPGGDYLLYWPNHDPMMRLSPEDLHHFQLSLRGAHSVEPPPTPGEPTEPDEGASGEGRRPRMVSPHRGAHAAIAAMDGLSRFAKLDGSQTAQTFSEWRRTQPPEFRPPSLPTIREMWPGVGWRDLLAIASIDTTVEVKVVLAHDLAKAAQAPGPDTDQAPADDAPVEHAPEPEPEPEPAADQATAPAPAEKRQRRRGAGRPPTSTDHDAWMALRRWAASAPDSYGRDAYDAWAPSNGAPSSAIIRRRLGRRWHEISVWVELEAARLLAQPDDIDLGLPRSRWWRRSR